MNRSRVSSSSREREGKMQGPSIFGSLVSQLNKPTRPTRFMSVLDELRRTGTVTSHGHNSSSVHNSQFVIRRPQPATAMLYDEYAQNNLQKKMATASHFSNVRRSSSATPECKESTLSELATSFTPDMHSSSLGDWRKSRNVDGISSRPRSGSQCIIEERVSDGSRGASTLNGSCVMRERPASSTAALHSNKAEGTRGTNMHAQPELTKPQAAVPGVRTLDRCSPNFWRVSVHPRNTVLSVPHDLSLSESAILPPAESPSQVI
jgi:hypothetical protein